MAQYHVGFAKRGRTLVIEARRSVDFLSCELYDYMGERVVTKKHLYDFRYDILKIMQARRPDVYGGLTFAIVD